MTQYAIQDQNRTPAQMVHSDTTNNAKPIRMTGQPDGSANIHVNDFYATKVTNVGNVTYVGRAVPGVLEATGSWQVMKIDQSVGAVVTWADGDKNFDNVATDLSSLTYA